MKIDLLALFTIFANTLAPILLAAGAGFSLGRFLHLDAKPLSRAVFYVLSQSLVFVSFMETKLSSDDLGRISLFVVGLIGSQGLLAFLLSKALNLDRPTTATFMTLGMFGNAANFGLSAILFAFGEEALRWGTIYYALSTMLVNTVGVIVASSGRVSFWESIKSIARLPLFYGMLVALAARSIGFEIPTPIMRTVTLLSGGSIPVMLLVLGIQLAHSQTIGQIKLVSIASLFKLLVGPATGIGLATLLGITGPAFQAVVMQSAMPTAVIITILAVEYNTDTTLATSVVLFTTLLSPLVLTPLIAYLQ